MLAGMLTFKRLEMDNNVKNLEFRLFEAKEETYVNILEW